MTDQLTEENRLEFSGIETTAGAKGVWMETYTGVEFYPFDPKPDQFKIEDMVRAIANQCRYNGHVRHFFSVAQHSVMGSYVAEDEYSTDNGYPEGFAREIARLFLLHDGIEGWIGDMIRPLKFVLTDFGLLEDALWKIFARRFGLPEELPHEVKVVDTIMTAWEKRDVKRSVKHWPNLPFIGDEYPEIYPQGPDAAYRAFVARFGELFPELMDDIEFDCD